VVIGGTTAYFSDTEESTGNTFTAGAIDLKIDSEAHYNDNVCDDGVWVGGTNYPVGLACGQTWGQDTEGVDIVGEQFFNYGDLKPGDEGENTISMHVVNNDAYMCVSIVNMVNDENGMTEPEEEVDTTADGDLGSELNFFAWADDGDNIFEEKDESGADYETPLFASPYYGPADDVLAGKVYPLYTPQTDAIAGGQTSYLGLYWCYGDISLVDGVLSCDGSTVGNESQTDILTADISFYVEQARNNSGFVCPVLEEEEEDGQKVGAAMYNYIAPNPSDCNFTVDSYGNTQFPTISSAIEVAEDGDVVCVADGLYYEFVVNNEVSILGLNVGGAEIVPSEGATEIALVNASNVLISGLHFDALGRGFIEYQAAGIRISPDGGDIENVEISYNLIENLEAFHENASNKGIQWHNNGSYSLNNSSFNNNVIRGIASESNGAYGIQTVGSMNNVSIENNTIGILLAPYGAGVAIDGGIGTINTNVKINNNQIAENAGFVFSVQIEHNVDQTGISVNTNNLFSFLHGGSGTVVTGDLVNAENNWWNGINPVDGVNVFGEVDFDPYAAVAYTLN
jgi:predicted ribosomally synthesized peptide with SipW-like signal peptide